MRVVVSGALSLPRDGHLGRDRRARSRSGSATTRRPSQARRAAWSELGAELIEIPFQPDGQLDLSAMMQRLGDRGLTRVLCEGGGRLAAALIEDDLVDEVVCYTAGLVLGAEAIPAVGALEVAALQLAPRFRLLDVDAGRPRPAQPLAPPRLSGWRGERPRRGESRSPALNRKFFAMLSTGADRGLIRFRMRHALVHD